MQRGPVSEDELRDLIKNGIISEETRVWKEGMADWLTVAEIPELKNSQIKKSGDSDAKPKKESNKEDTARDESSASRKSLYQKDQSDQRPETQVAAQNSDWNGPMPPTYTAQAIIGLVLGVLCCTPIAIPAVVAIVQGSKVKTLYDAGDFDAALEASGKAKYWCNIAMIALVAVVIIWILLMATGAIIEQ